MSILHLASWLLLQVLTHLLLALLPCWGHICSKKGEQEDKVSDPPRGSQINGDVTLRLGNALLHL